MRTVRAIVARAGWATIWYGATEDDERLKQLEVQIQALQKQVDTLQATVQTLQNHLSSPSAMAARALDPFVNVVPGVMNGLAGPHVIFSDANFHIRSGSGTTEDNTGLGNLVIGYDEDVDAGGYNHSRWTTHWFPQLNCRPPASVHEEWRFSSGER